MAFDDSSLPAMGFHGTRGALVNNTVPASALYRWKMFGSNCLTVIWLLRKLQRINQKRFKAVYEWSR